MFAFLAALIGFFFGMALLPMIIGFIAGSVGSSFTLKPDGSDPGPRQRNEVARYREAIAEGTYEALGGADGQRRAVERARRADSADYWLKMILIGLFGVIGAAIGWWFLAVVPCLNGGGCSM